MPYSRRDLTTEIGSGRGFGAGQTREGALLSFRCGRPPLSGSISSSSSPQRRAARSMMRWQYFAMSGSSICRAAFRKELG